MRKALHPKMLAHANAVKQAHAHLSKTIPGFRQLPARQQITHTRAHATKMLKRGGL